MTLIHKGIRPIHDIEMLDFKRKIYIEEFPDGSYRLWTNKQLKSGCGKTVNIISELMGCIYCKHCNEYFSKDQWYERDV